MFSNWIIGIRPQQFSVHTTITMRKAHSNYFIFTALHTAKLIDVTAERFAYENENEKHSQRGHV